MASSSSNIPPDASRYLYASNANVSNFVSVKLSGRHNHHLWKAQMLCLMESHNMRGIVDDTFLGPLILDIETHKQYDSLLKGWIFGSIGEEVLGGVYNLGSAKVVWKELNATYDTTSPNPIDLIATEPEAKTETNDIYAAPTQAVKETNDNIDILSIQVIGKEKDPLEIGTEVETKNKDKIDELCKELHQFTMWGDWAEAEKKLKENKDAATKAISKDGSTILHIAVGVGHNKFVKRFILFINDEQALEKKRHSDGSTALHIAAIVGNTDAAELMVKRNKNLLTILDHDGKKPLLKAYENMHLDTIGYLLKAPHDDGVGHKRLLNKILSVGKDNQAHDKNSTALHADTVELTATKNKKVLLLEDNKNKRPLQRLKAGDDADPIPSGDNCDPQHPGDEIGVDLLVNAISAKQYNLVSKFTDFFAKFGAKNDHVLMAMAKTFPSGLDEWETLMYPSLDSHWANVKETTFGLLSLFLLPILLILPGHDIIPKSERSVAVQICLLGMLGYIFLLIYFILSIVCLSLSFLYFIGWKIAEILALAPVYHIEKKKKEWDEAKKVLELICNEIDKLEFLGDHHPYYTEPILEAACQNAYEVVNEILSRSRETIRCKNECGYDIIQLAVIHRSEKTYNLIYDIGERRNLYRTILDSSKNNILHLAGRLAPSCRLNRRTGAALQLQRELQWREEVKKLVFPSYINQENMFKETPDMLFTREHENLVKEGERWMKTTAESCSITAVLITTIVFAAAITVPGGNNQETGTPVYERLDAFTVFAISDAISLFASSTALLVFLSILTSRFAEQDFLVSLPRRLIIGLTSLLVSTITMMVAFSASLFLVFGQQRKWVLIPICSLAFIPIAFFVTLQFPLMVDLFRSTFVSTFGKRSKGRFNPDDIRLFFR